MRAAERGFALPLAAAAIATLAVALAVAADAMGGASASLRRSEAQWRLDLASATLEARVAHIVLTSPLGVRALETRGRQLMLDGRPYVAHVAGAGAFAVSVQDEAGLFNLNVPDEAAIARLLQRTGAEPRRAESLSGALVDYTDADDLRRTHGAEAREYVTAGKAAPANAPILQLHEAWGALGWDELSRRQSRKLAALSSASDAARPFNPNTAPREVLAATFALDSRGLDALLELRERRTVVSFADAVEAAGGGVASGEIPVSAQPARDYRISIYAHDRPREGSSVCLVWVHVAQTGSDAPIIVRRVSVTGLDWERQTGDGPLDWLPDSPALPPERER